MIRENEYLSRKIIPVTFIIEDSHISIQSEHTSWINITKPKPLIAKEQMLDLYKEVKKLAKTANVSVSTRKNKYKEIIEKDYANYVECYNKSLKIFDEIKQLAYEIQARKIHMGCTDDEVLKQMANLKSDYCELLYYKSSPCSQLLSVYSSLLANKEELLRSIQSEKSNKFYYKLTKIYI